MLNRDYKDQDCSIARALEVVGERWTLLIVRDALLGLRRFDSSKRASGSSATSDRPAEPTGGGGDPHPGALQREARAL